MANNFFGRGHRPLPRIALLAAVSLPLAGCDLDTVLEVQDPDVVTPEIVRDPANLPGVRAGAIGDFAVAYSGQGSNTVNLIANVGLLTDELYLSDTFGTRREIDKRAISIENSEAGTQFRNLHRARRAAEVATELFAAGQPNTASHAEVINLAGYSYVLFAENYCSGVPFSRLREDNTLEHGPPQSTQQMYTTALARFDAALQAAGGASSTSAQARLARIGRARVLLGLNRYTEAAAAVSGIPTSYNYLIEHSENTSRQQNGVYYLTHERRGYGVAHREGGNGAPFRVGSSQDRATQDPRVPYTRTNTRAIDAPYAHFFQMKYPTRPTPVVLASGVEARLIEAEVALNRGASAAYLPTLNALRADASSILTAWGMATTGIALAPLTDPGTPAARVDQFFTERAFWLYLTGQRLSDMRRLVRQYGRPANTVFPSGDYRRLAYASRTTADANLRVVTAGTYGTDTNFPVPFDELNNPEFKQCENRNP